MLSWVGKRPLREVRAYPAQLVERFDAGGEASRSVDWTDWPDRFDRAGLLFHGDNKEGPGAPARERLPGQGGPGLHRPALRLGGRRRAPGAAPRRLRHGPTGRRDLHPGRTLDVWNESPLAGEAQDFMSPSIIERLNGQEGVLSPQITDWRAMVDSVMIDPSYDPEVLPITGDADA